MIHWYTRIEYRTLNSPGTAVKNRMLTAFSALVLASLFSAPVLARSVFDEGMEYYNGKRYHQAAVAFTKASIQEPANQTYRYYLANCLVHLRKHDRAIEEYRAAYTLDPKSSFGDYSAQALLGYHQSLPGASSDSHELGKAKNLIRAQTNTEKYKQTVLASRGELEVRAKVDAQIKAIDEQARADIQKLHDPLIFMPAPRANPLLAMPELLKEREDQIKLAAKQEKERLLKEAEERSKPFQSWKRGRDAALDEVAANLESQLEQPVGPSGIKLQAKGTDLYVRYYGKALPNKLPDARAATARIVPEGSDYELPTPPPNEKVEPKASSQQVKARLLKE